jgi:Domain of unknown function (DUF1961)
VEARAADAQDRNVMLLTRRLRPNQSRPTRPQSIEGSSTHKRMNDVFRAISVTIVCIAAASATAAAPPLPDSSDSTRGLDLTDIDLAPIYEADFSAPLKIVKESELFENERRVREPSADIDWVLEGRATARVDKGRLSLINEGGHLVMWSTRRFPADFLLEFAVIPKDADNGLNIVFFAATGRDGRSIFDLSRQMRAGEFKAYHSGELNAYHTSYWATREGGIARGSAHIRKNHGFHLVAVGKDFITGQGRGPHRVRILKLNGRIEVEVNGKLAVRWQDDGQSLGSALRGGFIGLRQMSHTRECSYTNFTVWEAARRVR